MFTLLLPKTWLNAQANYIIHAYAHNNSFCYCPSSRTLSWHSARVVLWPQDPGCLPPGHRLAMARTCLRNLPEDFLFYIAARVAMISYLLFSLHCVTTLSIEIMLITRNLRYTPGTTGYVDGIIVFFVGIAQVTWVRNLYYSTCVSICAWGTSKLRIM